MNVYLFSMLVSLLQPLSKTNRLDCCMNFVEIILKEYYKLNTSSLSILHSYCALSKDAMGKCLFSPELKPYLGHYDFRDAESSHKNGIYSLTRNVTEFVNVWMN